MAITCLRVQAIALVVLISRLAPASAQVPRPAPGVARPGCRDRCGNISIPYPFGISAGCYRDDGIQLQGFELVCDDTRSPPRLSISGYDHQLTGLSLAAGEATAYHNATRACYNTSGGLVDRTDGTMSLGTSPYLFSSAKNRLVSLGCPNFGFFVDMEGYYVGGCMSMCKPSRMPSTGVGCCESEISAGLNFFEPHQINYTGGPGGDAAFSSNSTTCRYVFLVETAWYGPRFNDVASLNRTGDFAVPVVLDWAVRNVGNCSAAERNMTDYACRSANSKCINSTNGAGYRCNCSKGYEGNPYLDGGCRDINECEHPDQYPCFGVCTNKPGGYHCQCRPGASGDAYRQNGCRDKDKFTLALKVVTGTQIIILSKRWRILVSIHVLLALPGAPEEEADQNEAENLPYKFKQQDVLDLEEGSTYTFSM
ncbi:hypothetical protein EJB05_19279, partial [Eragrostis curvula]